MKIKEIEVQFKEFLKNYLGALTTQGLNFKIPPTSASEDAGKSSRRWAQSGQRRLLMLLRSAAARKEEEGADGGELGAWRWWSWRNGELVWFCAGGWWSSRPKQKEEKGKEHVWRKVENEPSKSISTWGVKEEVSQKPTSLMEKKYPFWSPQIS